VVGFITGVIVNPTAGLITPDKAAVILAFPAASPVAIPHESREIVLLSLDQTTLLVISTLELSE
jgi:hypothetical protein